MRLGVVGFGLRANAVIGCMRAEEPELRVVGIVDPEEAAARSRLNEREREVVVFYDSLNNMVRKAKLDALMIGTRCHLHTPYAIQASRYDLPLFLEKPASNSMEQALSLEQAFEHTKCQVVVSFPLRVTPLCIHARSLIEEGAVGNPEHILAVNYVSYGTIYFDEQYREYEITQGLFLQKATHDLDYMMYLMGANIVKVAAMASCGRVFGGTKPVGLVCAKCDEAETCLESPENRKRNLSGGRTDDHPCLFSRDLGTPETGMNEDSSSALVEFTSGAHGLYTQVFYSRRDAGRRGATVSGYQGTVSFEWGRNHLTRVRHHKPFTDIVNGAQGLGHFGGDQELARNFLDIIKGKAPSRTPIRAGIQSVYTCLAAKQSAETGQFVQVRQVGQTGA